MLSRDLELSEITDLNQLKLELNHLPAVDVGDYISELPPERRAIAFRLLVKDRAIDVFECLAIQVLVAAEHLDLLMQFPFAVPPFGFLGHITGDHLGFSIHRNFHQVDAARPK